MNFIQKLRSACRFMRAPMRSLRYLSISTDVCHSVGSSEWFVATEKHFGGYHTNTQRRKVSQSDPRARDEVTKGGMTGGDRMFHHGYAPAYADALDPFVRRRNDKLTIVEIGILKGTGLALWSTLFPNSDIIGLDIDLSHTNENMNFLKSRGAFTSRPLELHFFDQLESGPRDVERILAGRRIDICIDDGLHSEEAIVNTANAIVPHLSDDCIYFIEDYSNMDEKISRIFPHPVNIVSYEELSIIKTTK